LPLRHGIAGSLAGPPPRECRKKFTLRPGEKKIKEVSKHRPWGEI
jgi:hypothetical protein